MRRIGIFLLWVMALPSCQEEATEVSFRIKTSDFHLEQARLNDPSSFPSFKHRISGGVVTFTGKDHIYEFELKETGLEDFEFRLPAGEYMVEVRNPPASLYGQDAASFTAPPLQVTLPAFSDTVTMPVDANCSLILVKDEHDQLDEGIYMIQRQWSGYVRYFPLQRDTLSGLYYTYFTPDTVPMAPSAFLWFYGRGIESQENGLSTALFEKGFQYHIEILD
jgi:hypothetical protein